MLSQGISMSGLHSCNITYYDHFILPLLFQPALLFCFPASAISWIPESPSSVLHLVIFSTEIKLKWLGKHIQGHLWTCHSLSRVKNLFLLYVNFTFIIYRKHSIGFPPTLMSSTSSLWFLHAAFQILWLVDLWIHQKQLYYLGQATRCSFSDKHANELLFTVFCKAIYVYI